MLNAEFVTPRKACELLRCSPSKLQQLSREGFIMAARTGCGHRRYNVAGYLKKLAAAKQLEAVSADCPPLGNRHSQHPFLQFKLTLRPPH